MLRRPPVKETVFQNTADRKAAVAPAVGKLVVRIVTVNWNKYFDSITVPLKEYSKGAEIRVAEDELVALGVRHPNDLLSKQPL